MKHTWRHSVNQDRTDVMARHYCIAAIWADCEEDTHPRASAQAMRVARNRCAAFLDRAAHLLDAVAECKEYGAHPDCGAEHPQFAAMGHDLYLTSAGHGVGFWCRDSLTDGLRTSLTVLCENRDPCTEFYRGWLYFNGYADDSRERLEYLRTELRAERISYGELLELQALQHFIKPGDMELLEAAGLPEFQEDQS